MRISDWSSDVCSSDLVVGVGIHLVAVPGLAGAAVAAAIMANGAIALGGEEHHLRLPGIGTEGPAVAEHHRLPAAPVLVVELGAVLHRQLGQDRTSVV